MMDRSLAEHIQVLEEKLSSVSAAVMRENDSAKRNELEAELRAVDSVLSHYRSASDALDIESRITAPGSALR